MKFQTLQEARNFAWWQMFYTKMKHKPIKTQYWSNKEQKYIKCYTVQIVFK